MPNIDLKKLRAFDLVAKHGTLSRAASLLRLTVPAVSIQIRALEEELGTTLFYRFGKRLAITPQGEVFLAELDAVFSSLDRAVQSVSRQRTDLVRISIALSSDLARYFSGAIADVVQAHPTAHLSLRIRSSPEIMALVTKGEVDIGLGYFSNVPSELEKRVLIKSGFSLVCPPEYPLSHRRKPNLNEIAKHRLITLQPYTSTGGRVIRAFSKAGVEASGMIESGSCQTSQDLVEKRLGVAIVHTLCIDHGRPRRMRSVDVSRYFGSVDVAIIRLKTHRPHAVHSDFISFAQSMVSRSAHY